MNIKNIKLQEEKIFINEDYKDKLSNISINSGIITIGQQGSVFFLQTIRTMVLARLLSIDDFGLIAMVATITSFASMFKDAGLSMATVQKEKITEAEISNLFWINVLISGVLGAIIMSCSPLIALFYGRPELTLVTVVLGFSFIISGISIQHQALLRRHMKFIALAVINIVALISSAILTILLAVCGINYWALVGGALLQSIVLVFLTLFFCPWRPKKYNCSTNVRFMLKFGMHLTSFDFINYFARNLDNILIGRIVGSEALGLYSKAYQIVYLPITNIRVPINNVAIPVMAKIKNEIDRFKNYFYKQSMILAIISIPLMTYIVVNSRELILLIFGPNWLHMNMVFKTLAVAAIFQTSFGTKGPTLISLGKTKQYLQLGVITAVLTVVGFIIGINWGVQGIALSYIVSYYTSQIFSFAFVFKHTPINLRDVIKPLYPTVIATAIAFICGSILLKFVGSMHFLLIIIINFICMYGVFVIIMLIIPRGKEQINYLFNLGIKKLSNAKKKILK